VLDIGGDTVARGPSVPEVLGKRWSSVQRGIRSRGRAIRLPVLTGDRVTKTHAVCAAMTTLLERTPTPDELGERPGRNEEAPPYPLGAPELCSLERPVHRST